MRPDLKNPRKNTRWQLDLVVPSPPMPDEKLEGVFLRLLILKYVRNRNSKRNSLFSPPSLSLVHSVSPSVHLDGGLFSSCLPSSPLILPPSTSASLSVSDLLAKRKNRSAFSLIGSCCLTLTLCGLEGFQSWFYQN